MKNQTHLLRQADHWLRNRSKVVHTIEAQQQLLDIAQAYLNQSATLSHAYGVLEDAKNKLLIYFKQTDGLYNGGVEYSELVKRINEILEEEK